MASGVTLITPTGGRSETFALCVGYIQRQTWGGPLQWIIVDDGPSPYVKIDTALFHNPNFLLTRFFPVPQWTAGKNTQARNIRAAIPEVLYDKVLFIEDDDWYAPDYVEAQAARLEISKIVGERPAIYYHIEQRRICYLGNNFHASLCQTGIRASLLPKLDEICQHESQTFIDVQLWDAERVDRNLYLSHRCIGMKGLPGRPGIGNGHRLESSASWKYDTFSNTLRRLIGDEDTEAYGRFYDGR